MLTLLNALIDWLVAALALGAGVGFLTSAPAKPVRTTGGPLWVVALFGAGLVAALLHWLPARQEIGLVTALMLVAAYAAGCGLGCVFHAIFRRSAPIRGAAPLALSQDRDGRAAAVAETPAASAEPFEPPETAAAAPRQADQPAKSAAILQRLSELGDVPALAAAATQLSAAPDPVAPGENPESLAAKAAAANVLAAESAPAASPAVAATASATAAMSQLAAAALAPEAAATHAIESATPPSPIAAPEPAADHDELRLIQGIGPATAKKLRELGVWRFGQIAGWTDDQTRWMSQRLGHSSRVELECWIAQARLLGAGVDTEFARAIKNGETRFAVRDETPLSESEAEALAAALPQASSPQPSDELYAGLRPLGLLQPLRGERDDLGKIAGVDARTAERLNALGIWTFGQIARWTPENTRWIGSYLAVPGKIEREKWVEQARRLTAAAPL